MMGEPGQALRDAGQSVGRRGWRELAVLLTGVAMAAMATATASVAAPSIQSDLHLSGAVLELVASGYVVAYAVLLMTGARLGERGHRRMFLVGLTVLTVAAGGSGLAVTGWMLITGQVLEGVGAALMVPQVLSLIQIRFRGVARSRAFAMYALVLAVGVAAGQLLGGLLVTVNLFGSSWRAIFLIYVPIGILALIAARRTLPVTQADARRPLDIRGALILTLALLGIVVPLVFGSAEHWPVWTWICLIVGAVGLTVFARGERALALRGDHPLLDLHTLAVPGARSGLFVVFIVHGGYGVLLFTISLHLQEGLRYSPLGSGLTFATYAAGFAAANLTWSRLPHRLHRFVPLCGLLILMTSEAGLSVSVRTGWTYHSAGPLLLLAGVGHGAGFGTVIAQITARARPSQVPNLSGLITTISQLAVVTGIAVLGGLYLALVRPGDPASFDHALSLVALILTIVSALGACFAVQLARRAASLKPVSR